VKLWLVRHARPVHMEGVCYGRLDVPADDGDTRQVAALLSAELPPGIALWTSPLRRCRALADALREQRPDIACHIDAGLGEMDFGDWEGRSWDHIGPTALDTWVADFAHHRPGGGECVTAFMARVARAFDAALDVGRDCVWITHAGVARAVLLLSRGQRLVTRADEWPREGLAFGRWQALELDPAQRAA
jgi:alpha-ribazole phosphatase